MGGAEGSPVRVREYRTPLGQAEHPPVLPLPRLIPTAPRVLATIPTHTGGGGSQVWTWSSSPGTGKLGMEAVGSIRGLGIAGQELTCDGDSGAGLCRPVGFAGLPDSGEGATGVWLPTACRQGSVGVRWDGTGFILLGWDTRRGRLWGPAALASRPDPCWATREGFWTSLCLSFPISYTVR